LTPYILRYVIFTIMYVHTRSLFCRTLSSEYDENKLCVSYLQPKFTKVSTECVIRKPNSKKTTSRGLVQVLVIGIKCMWLIILRNVIAFYRTRVVLSVQCTFRKGTYTVRSQFAPHQRQCSSTRWQ